MGSAARRFDRRTIARKGPADTSSAPRTLARHRIFFRQWAGEAIKLTDKLITRLPAILARARRELGIREDSVDHYAGLTLRESLELDERIQVFARELGIRIDAPAASEFVEKHFDRISVQYGKIEEAQRPKSSKTVTTTDDLIDETNRRSVQRQIAAEVAKDATIPNVVTPLLISREHGMTGGTRKKWIDHSLSLIVDKGGPRVPPIPTKHFREAKKIINLGVRRNTLWTEVAKELRQLNGISRRRADLIGHDQVNKHNARMTETRHRSMGIKSYFWTTQGDEKVRDEHREREGVEFQNNFPPPDGHAGAPVGCR